MATTTPNYGWTVPTSTDLVKDGATAIETLGDAIDASMNTALGTKKAGMVLLNTTSFSGVSSVSLPANTFTSTYTNYRIMYLAEVNSVGQLTMRLRAAGSDNTTSNYSFQNFQITNTSLAAGRGTSQTSWEVIYQQAYDNPLTIDLFRPQATAKTVMLSSHMKDPYNLGAAMSIGQVGGGFNATTSFDSATFIASAGQITGTVFAYGYNI